MIGTGSDIKHNTLGRTGLRVSQIGLGAGGVSCLGLKKGKTEAESVQLVMRAIELGINLVDTSGRNGTEHIIRRGIRGYDRDKLVLSSKRVVSEGSMLCTAGEFADSLEESLRVLDTPYIDIMHFHGVLPQEYDYVVTELLPVMDKFRSQGKVRFIGLTEAFDRDRDHRMLRRALADDWCDVMMIGFNMINQSARSRVFSKAQEKNIGILGMFAVRRALGSAEALGHALLELQSLGELSTDVDVGEIIKRLTGRKEPGKSLVDIAYRYCRDEPAIHSVLVGTGEIGHLERNVKTFIAPPLPVDTRRFIDQSFNHISNFSGN